MQVRLDKLEADRAVSTCKLNDVHRHERRFERYRRPHLLRSDSESEKSDTDRSLDRFSIEESERFGRCVPRRSPRSGRAHRSLSELNPNSKKFRRVLSYKTYRLMDTNPGEGSRSESLPSFAVFQTTQADLKLDGADPISILTFLAAFKEKADPNRISEVSAKLVLRYCMAGKAKMAFSAALHVNAVDSLSMGIRTWPEAVQWLLRTYAKDSYIQRAVQDLRALRQKDGETETNFGDRLIAKFSRLGGVFSQEDQINQYIEGLDESIASCVNRDRQINPNMWGVETHRLAGPMPPNWRVGGKRGFI